MSGVTEQEIQAITVAPRVTKQDVLDFIKSEKYLYSDTLTFCVLTLENGFTVTGESACASLANYNKEIGDRLAKENATNKIWGLLGFELRSRLSLIEKSGKPSGQILNLGSPVTYVGTKVIHAVAMTRLDYNIYRGWQLPKDENGDDNGYLVEYADGGTPNVFGHTGYVSWSPADVFEKAYGTPVRQKPETFLDRMRKEFDELEDRHDKLDAFIKSPNFNKIPDIEQEDLTMQRGAMCEYMVILARRIVRNSQK